MKSNRPFFFGLAYLILVKRSLCGCPSTWCNIYFQNNMPMTIGYDCGLQPFKEIEELSLCMHLKGVAFISGLLEFLSIGQQYWNQEHMFW